MKFAIVRALRAWRGAVFQIQGQGQRPLTATAAAPEIRDRGRDGRLTQPRPTVAEPVS